MNVREQEPNTVPLPQIGSEPVPVTVCAEPVQTTVSPAFIVRLFGLKKKLPNVTVWVAARIDVELQTAQLISKQRYVFIFIVCMIISNGLCSRDRPPKARKSFYGIEMLKPANTACAL